MKFEWNIPNALGIFRVVLIPFNLYLAAQMTPRALLWALILYIIGALTDTFDGIIARKLHQVTEFGKFFDPLADKFLVLSFFVLFALMDPLRIPMWMVALIALRDLIITLMRTQFNKRDLKFTTSVLAKSKTAVQMVLLGVILLYLLLTYHFGKTMNLTFDEHSASMSFELIWRTKLGRVGGKRILNLPLILTTLVTIYTYVSAVSYFKDYKEKLLKKG